jgi:DNA primase
MMRRRFSAQELFELRNDIPVNDLIQDHLRMVAKRREGQLRFLCPICNEFNTATKQATNLARCFRCERNFNTIDLVMIVNGSDFVESVRYLKRLLKEISPHEDRSGALKQMLQQIGNH